MDEFCANKDANLARCACSNRATEFDKTKKSLDNIEEKLLDFNERLLIVNMDAEDVAAMNQATAGELAFNTDDKSKSKKMLDEIAKKLNTSFDDSNFDNSLNAINLSLNMDAAFDSVDSMMGATTATKIGPALYNAALPVCREMAAEVCTPDELTIAESGYQMIIEQDCNTVAKTYQTQTDLARTKVFESGALLDMSRLDIYQQRNSDDILTCKAKMLDMLSNSNICGTDMGKCLDMSGKYIDPTTGTAFLTEDLYELESLLTRPSGNETWSSIPNNQRFVTFLNSKKAFLEPAMENCQDISGYVWDEFIDDALAQIKLAQTKKLEDVRQSCTTLTTQCLDDAMDSISEFDARALSIFGVAADSTVNAMCADVRNACTVLMDNVLDDTPLDSEWGTGMSEIALSKTYDTIISTCSEIGRQCIINTCKSISGNFGLCTSIHNSVNRRSILNRDACWDEVEDCVASAGTNTIDAILQSQGRNDNSKLYETYNGYNNPGSNIHKWCEAEEDPNLKNTCLITEEIWGNCEKETYDFIEGDTLHNRIYISRDNKRETLLSWFARNTDTHEKDESCYTRIICNNNEIYSKNLKNCVSKDLVDSLGEICISEDLKITINNSNLTNCCNTGKTDAWGNCCENGMIEVSINDHYFGTNNFTDSTNGNNKICAPKDATVANLVASYTTTDNIIHNIICFGEVAWDITPDPDTNDNYPNGKTVTCNGTLVDIQKSDNTNTPAAYYTPTASISYYKSDTETKCDSNGNGNCDDIQPIQHWLIDYNYTNGVGQ